MPFPDYYVKKAWYTGTALLKKLSKPYSLLFLAFCLSLRSTESLTGYFLILSTESLTGEFLICIMCLPISERLHKPFQTIFWVILSGLYIPFTLTQLLSQVTDQLQYMNIWTLPYMALNSTRQTWSLEKLRKVLYDFIINATSYFFFLIRELITNTNSKHFGEINWKIGYIFNTSITIEMSLSFNNFIEPRTVYTIQPRNPPAATSQGSWSRCNREKLTILSR